MGQRHESSSRFTLPNGPRTRPEITSTICQQCECRPQPLGSLFTNLNQSPLSVGSRRRYSISWVLPDDQHIDKHLGTRRSEGVLPLDFHQTGTAMRTFVAFGGVDPCSVMWRHRNRELVN